VTDISHSATPGIWRLYPGISAVAFYAAHASYWVRRRKAENAMWACHLGCLLVGIGWAAAWPSLNALGVLWLLPGLVLWVMYLAGGGPFRWTSFLTHIGGLVLGIWGVSQFGFPRGVWWKAGTGFAALIMISRRVSRASENVNFAVQVWRGWEHQFPSHRRYLAGLVLGGFALFLSLEQAMRWMMPGPN